MSLHIIRRNDERYGDGGNKGPKELCIEGTVEQAKWIAERLSAYYPGCDFFYYAEESDDERN